MNIDTLDVPGATLYYEVRGAGPVLLLICGGVYDAEGYRPLAEQLADRYTVITYDRRGNSRSPLSGEPGPQRIEEHADDARLLLETVVPGQAVDVFGNSSGAIIALDLAARYPELVRAVVAHEPPMFDLLPDHERWRELTDRVDATFEAEGPWAALGLFNSAFEPAGEEEAVASEDGPAPGPEAEPAPGPQAEPALGPEGEPALGPEAEPDAATAARLQANLPFFIGYEVPHFAKYRAELGKLGGLRVLPAVGAAGTDEPWVRAGHALAERLGTKALVFPGDHGGFGTEAAAFAVRLDEAFGPDA
jgi:pimeloyl-ACP methyl ester carboxylesterase